MKSDTCCSTSNLLSLRTKLDNLLKKIEELEKFNIKDKFLLDSDVSIIWLDEKIKKGDTIEIIDIKEAINDDTTSQIVFQLKSSWKEITLSKWIFMIHFCKDRSLKQDFLKKESKELKKQLKEIRKDLNKKTTENIELVKEKVSLLISIVSLFKKKFKKRKNKKK